jgi:rhodanese-related sulfurtransferase
LVLFVLSVVLLVACGGVATPTRVAATLTPPAAGTYGHVSPAELDALLAHKDFVFVNVHTPYEGEIASTDAFIPYDEVGQKPDRLPADKGARIVLYCRSGHMSTIAAQTLVRLGYTNVWSLDGGMAAWEATGHKLLMK